MSNIIKAFLLEKYGEKIYKLNSYLLEQTLETLEDKLANFTCDYYGAFRDCDFLFDVIIWKRMERKKMTITLYINWECQEIYKTEEELVEGYLEYACVKDDFRDWLDNNYSSDEIFAFTEYEKEDVKMSYQEELLKSAQYWAEGNNMIQEIEV